MLPSILLTMEKGNFLYNKKTGEKLKLVEYNVRDPFVKVRNKKGEHFELILTDLSKIKPG
jgi:CRISPR/Cas system-associated protein Cas10 (large subunit of type III CRISPR-Cas system)